MGVAPCPGMLLATLTALSLAADAPGMPPRPPPPPQMFVYADPLKMMFGIVNVEVERHLGDPFSVYGGGGLGLSGQVWEWQAGVRYYLGPLKGTTTVRPFLDVHAHQSHVQGLQSFEGSSDQLGGGGLLGLRMATDWGLAASLGLGMDIAEVRGRPPTIIPAFFLGPEQPVTTTAVPMLRVSVGYGF